MSVTHDTPPSPRISPSPNAPKWHPVSKILRNNFVKCRASRCHVAGELCGGTAVCQPTLAGGTYLSPRPYRAPLTPWCPRSGLQKAEAGPQICYYPQCKSITFLALARLHPLTRACIALFNKGTWSGSINITERNHNHEIKDIGYGMR